jgi:adenylate kinase
MRSYKLIIAGIQGSGKGTQAAMLMDRFDLVHISTGDIFRWHINNRTQIGSYVQDILHSGQLVPADFTNKLVDERLQMHDWHYGLVLDGYPRDSDQANHLLQRYNFDKMLYLDISEQEVQNRLVNRKICIKCGRDQMSMHSHMKHGKCDRPDCPGKFITRADDKPEIIHARIKSYYENTLPVIEMFKENQMLITINGEQSPDAVHEEIVNKLSQAFPVV